jgi:hypothetical protein
MISGSRMGCLQKVVGVGYVCIGGYWEFRHDCDHVVIDGNLCSNLGFSRGRLSNIYYKC